MKILLGLMLCLLVVGVYAYPGLERCKPGDPGIVLASVVLLAGCKP